MASSFLSNWETVNHLDSNTGPFYELQSELTDELLLGFFSDPFEASLLPLDSLDQFYNEVDLLPSFNHHSYSAPSMFTAPPYLHPAGDHFNHYQCPKRFRSCSDLYHSSDLVFDASSCIVGPSDVASCRECEFATEFLAPPPVEFVQCNVERKTVSGTCLSAQSVAARERRKRISEKTQELGRLIPGGNRMNTAEMFQAAYKYVKFLQAQVAILGLMGSIEGCEVPQQVDEQLQVLLATTVIQEKLYGEGRCVVPKVMVEAIATDQEVKSNQLISRDLDRFIGSME